MAIKLKAEYIDGTTEEQNIYSSDFVRYEREARKQNWGPAQENPFLANTFLMYSALYRTRATDMEYSDWLDTVAIVRSIDAEGEGEGEGEGFLAPA